MRYDRYILLAMSFGSFIFGFLVEVFMARSIVRDDLGSFVGFCVLAMIVLVLYVLFIHPNTTGQVVVDGNGNKLVFWRETPDSAGKWLPVVDSSNDDRLPYVFSSAPVGSWFMINGSNKRAICQYYIGNGRCLIIMDDDTALILKCERRL